MSICRARLRKHLYCAVGGEGKGRERKGEKGGNKKKGKVNVPSNIGSGSTPLSHRKSPGSKISSKAMPSTVPLVDRVNRVVMGLTDHVDELDHCHAEFDVYCAGQIAHRTNEWIVVLEQVLYESHLVRTAKA